MSDAPSEAVQPASDAPTAETVLQAAAQLAKRGDVGANWFFWIAGLSLVNTAITHGGGDTHFVVGMGLPLIVSVIAHEIAKQNPDISMIATIVGIGFSVLCSLVACLFGWLSRKRIIAIFAIGMVLYLLDGMVFLLIQDWMSIAFHAFALFSMWGGLSAYRQLNQLERHLSEATA